MADKLKIFVALLIIGASVFAFYYYPDESVLLRAIGIVAAIAVATFVFMQTVSGQNAWAFVQASKQEVKKVVRPTPKETMQTTGMVILMVIIIAIFLWLLDLALIGGIKLLTQQGV